MRAPIHPVPTHPVPIHLAPTSQVATYITTLPNSASQLWLAVTIVALLFAHVTFYVPTVNAETTVKPVIATSEPMVVYKSPSCGCCGAWIDQMTEAGFSSTIKHPSDLNSIKQQLGVAPRYQACHTATQSEHVFEGHIPADVIQHFLDNTPSHALGLAVPGMPMGSPGMDMDRDTEKKFRPYTVLQLNKDGSSTPYAAVSAREISYQEKP